MATIPITKLGAEKLKQELIERETVTRPDIAKRILEAKELGDCLIVAINDDDSVTRLKGAGRPINNVEQRGMVLAQAVDLVPGILLTVAIAGNVRYTQVNTQKAIHVLWRWFIDFAGRKQVKLAVD